jgi:hypothetical protein
MGLVDEKIVVTSADAPGARRAFPLGFQLGLVGLTTLALTLALVCLPIFSVSFWFLGEALRQKLGSPIPIRPLWPLLGATLASWGVVFLAHDRIAVLGNARAERFSLERASLLLGESLPEQRVFVELRLRGYPPDTGWLFLEESQLRFIGEVLQARLPRTAFHGKPRTLASLGGLLAAYVELPLEGKNSLRLLPREGIVHLSDTRKLAPELVRRLQIWLDASPSE